MGNFSSKELQDLLECFEPPTELVCEVSTISCKAPAQRSVNSVSEADPRSPSVGIPRTPVEISKEKLSPVMPRHLESDSTLVLENKTEMVISRHLITSDPRSPSFGITRTPIQVVCTCTEEEKTDKTLVLVADPRSPNIHLPRTPIQVQQLCTEEAACTVQTSTGLLETDLDAVLNITSKPTANVADRPIVQEKANSQTKEKKHDSKSFGDGQVFQCDKENGSALKKKLFDTPDSSPVQSSSRKLRFRILHACCEVPNWRHFNHARTCPINLRFAVPGAHSIGIHVQLPALSITDSTCKAIPQAGAGIGASGSCNPQEEGIGS